MARRGGVELTSTPEEAVDHLSRSIYSPDRFAGSQNGEERKPMIDLDPLGEGESGRGIDSAAPVKGNLNEYESIAAPAPLPPPPPPAPFPHRLATSSPSSLASSASLSSSSSSSRCLGSLRIRVESTRYYPESEFCLVAPFCIDPRSASVVRVLRIMAVAERGFEVRPVISDDRASIPWREETRRGRVVIEYSVLRVGWSQRSSSRPLNKVHPTLSRSAIEAKNGTETHSESESGGRDVRRTKSLPPDSFDVEPRDPGATSISPGSSHGTVNIPDQRDLSTPVWVPRGNGPDKPTSEAVPLLNETNVDEDHDECVNSRWFSRYAATQKRRIQTARCQRCALVLERAACEGSKARAVSIHNSVPIRAVEHTRKWRTGTQRWESPLSSRPRPRMDEPVEFFTGSRGVRKENRSRATPMGA
ncbi:unnamed protein product [Notodromas monacha]|uniref:Uncharacterized protein n=1 Tax=Notodromas monacha TaxID=399045 RepID=A0A7R9BFB0_9CRUS|nr:unnamed protein product [Notodromas monacha]CAG0914335.1 unnamed protein product [Notodromas monacha]